MNNSRGKILKVVAVIVLVLLLGAGAVGLWAYRQFHRFMGSMLQPAQGQVVSEYNDAPAPANVGGDKIRQKIQGVKNSLFFLNHFVFFGKVEVDFDSFLLPNSGYAKVNATWTQLLGEGKKNILRQPTAKEKADDGKMSSQPLHIYVTDKDAVPMQAQGSVQLHIPCKFSQVTFMPRDTKVTRKDARLSATLESCRNDVAELKLQGISESDQEVLVFRDVTGGRLQTTASESMTMHGVKTITTKTSGIIDKIEVYLPVEFVDSRFDVQATAEPTTIGSDNIEAQYPRYVAESAPLKSESLDPATLKSRTQVFAKRSEAMIGENTPEVVVALPRVLNSAYATIDFGTPKLLNSAGGVVPYELENGGFDSKAFSAEVRFTTKGKNQPVKFAHAVGTVHLKYPVKVSLVSLTSAQPAHGVLKAAFHGAKVTLAGYDGSLEMNSFLPDAITLLRAYDASGRQLKKLNYSGFAANSREYAFWGHPVELRVVQVDQWQTLDIPFDLPPAK